MTENSNLSPRDRILQASTVGARPMSEPILDDPQDPSGLYTGASVLTDDEWQCLKALSGLTDGDHIGMEKDVRLYRNNRDAQLSAVTFTPKETREQLNKLARNAYCL